MKLVETAEKLEMSPAEWQTRCDLAALYRMCDYFGWTDILATHMSARIPGEPNTFLINHYEEMFDEITASSLIKMDLDGNIIGKQGRYNTAGLTIHSGVYKARPDANCVMHTHTRAGAGLSMIRKGLRPISQDALIVYDDVVYHEYGMPSSKEECDSLGVSCLGGNSVILYNHGLLTLGDTIPGTLWRMYTLERACELELIARTLGEPPVEIDPLVVSGIAKSMQTLRKKADFGVYNWKALLRKIEKQGNPYRV
jgi:ribulose-5-phosphate 4-epimerase/fuculose-1-phosphate aldolase